MPTAMQKNVSTPGLLNPNRKITEGLINSRILGPGNILSGELSLTEGLEKATEKRGGG